jgi:hypothetical protein
MKIGAWMLNPAPERESEPQYRTPHTPKATSIATRFEQVKTSVLPDIHMSKHLKQR